MRILYIFLILILTPYTVFAKSLHEMSSNVSPDIVNDLIYSQDVSDTSEASTGTGKSVTIYNLLRAGNIFVDGVNVGIGTFSTGAKLFVNGTIQATSFVGDGSGLTGIAASASNDAYGISWSGDATGIASKNALYDKFESIGEASISDDIYGVAWNGDTTSAPSKNAVYDKIQTLGSGGGSGGTDNYTSGLSYSMISQTSFNQENQNTAHSTNLKTYNGNQYICYIDSDRKIVLGKRPSGGLWTTYKYDGTGGRPNVTTFDVDNHNTCNIGIDDLGYIHVAYNMHADPLLYRRSTFSEDVSNLGSALSMVGTNESFVTYPVFFNNNSGQLYVIFRDGVSGNGDEYMYKYNSGTSTWSAATGTSTGGKFMDGKTSSISAYFNVPVVDSNNVAHFGFIWRESSGADTGFDIGYVKYDMTSGAFYKYTGASQTIPMTSTNDTPAATLSTGSGLANGTSKYGTALDSNNYPYITYYKNDANGNTNYYVTAFNGTTWSTHGPISKGTESDVTQDPIAGLNNSMVVSTPGIIIDSEDNVYIFGRYNELGQGIIVWKSTTDDLDNWNQFSIYNGSVGKMLISFDNGYWKSSGKVDFIIAPVLGYRNVATQTGTNTPNIGILEWIPATGEHVQSYNYNRIMTADDIEMVSNRGDVNISGSTFSVGNQVLRVFGNVGIGTMTAPSGTVEIVKRGSDVPFMISSTAAGDGNYVTVTSSGNVGIGTWAPTRALDVNGDVKIRTLTTGQCVQTSTNGLLVGTGSPCGSGGGGSVTIGTTSPMTGAGTGSSFTLGVDSTLLSGTAPNLTAGNVTTNANLTGEITSVGNAATISDSVTVTGWNLGASTATTPSGGDNDTSIATTAYVQTELSGISGGSGGWTDGGSNIYQTTTTDLVAIGTTTPSASLHILKNGSNDYLKINSTVGAGGNVLRLENGGNIGIGTTSNIGGTKLQVVGPSSSNGDDFIALFAENGISPEISTLTSAGGTGRAIMVQGNGGAYVMGRDITNDIEFIMGTSNAGAAFAGSLTAHDLQFRTTNATKMIIQASSGNVGIGSVSPTGLLNVSGGYVRVGNGGTNSNATSSGELYVQGDAEVDGTIYGNISGNAATVTTNANLTGDVTSSGNATTLSSSYKGWTDGGTNVYTSTTTDTVGIGTTTPSTTLEIVKQGSSAPVMVSATATGDGNYLIINSSGVVGIGTTSPRGTTTGTLDLGPTGTLYLQTITGPTGPTILGTSNNVGIGTITAGSLLTVGSTGQAAITSAGVATLPTPILTGKIDINNVAVNDDDCTGEQGLLWYDSTDSAFEFCKNNSGTPERLGQPSPPASQTITAGATITADACGTFKDISSAGAVTTDTTNTFTAPSSDLSGCCMNVVNTGANNITLDNNSLFYSAGAADVVLGLADSAIVCTNGTVWAQMGGSNN